MIDIIQTITDWGNAHDIDPEAIEQLLCELGYEEGDARA